MSSYNWPNPGGAGGVPIYATFSSFPSGSEAGDLAVAADTGNLYEWSGSAWQQIAGPGAAISLGNIDAQAAGAKGASLTGGVLSMQSADATHAGLINTASQSIAGQKTFTTGLTGTLTGHASLDVATSSLGDLTDAGTDGIIVTGGVGSVVGAVSLAQHVADTTHNGYLSSTDWNTFNGKQAAGNYITALTGDATASGPGSAALSLATVNANVGSFGSASAVSTFTVNAKGLVTAAGSSSIQIAESQVTNLVSDLAGKQATLTIGNLTDVGTDGIVVTGGTGSIIGAGVSLAQHVADTTHNGYLSSTDWNTFNGKQAAGNYITALTGDATASGPGSSALTFATVNSNVGSFGSSTSIPSLTVNAKGLVTAASGNVVIAPAGTLTGATLAAGVTASSLTSVGTITTGTWTGTTIAIANGGTGQTAKAAAFDALQPMTTGGDIIYGGASGTGTRLANGSNGQILTSSGGTSAPTWQTTSLVPVILHATNAGVACTANTTITSWTTVKDTNSGFNASTGVYTVAVAGTYHVDFQSQLTTNTNADPQVRVNGTLKLEGSSITAAAGEGNVHGLLIDLAVNDTVTVSLQSSATLASNAVFNWWSLYRI